MAPQTRAEETPVLARLARLIQSAHDDIRLLHVGPQPIADAGERYRHHKQLSPGVFQRLIQTADMVMTPNQSATTISTALVLGVPAAAVISTVSAPPIQPFRVFRIGVSEFVKGLVENNPYTDAVPSVELHPGDAVVDIVRKLALDDAARADLRARASRYLELVRKLPSGADRFYEVLDS
jgi:hypothetical protein